ALFHGLKTNYARTKSDRKIALSPAATGSARSRVRDQQPEVIAMRFSSFQLQPVATGLLVLLLAGSACAQVSGANRVLTIDDILGLTRVSAPAISPDGAWVAYVVEQVDGDKDEKITSIRMVSADGAETVQLTSMERSVSNPA